MTLTRSRWAAVGAAVAVTLGAGGIGLVSATNPDNAVTFVPITPCRVFDTRPGVDNVGPRATPLGSGETFTVQATGTSGNCTEVPAEATGVSMNVTSVGPTAPTFLTIWAAGETMPLASSLNPVPGEPPTPNGVMTELSATGQFSIYNLAGTVNVLADINGYYIDHNHDDRYSPAGAFGFIDAAGVAADNTVGLALEGGVDFDPLVPGVYGLTLEGLEFDPALHTVLVTPACPGFTASAEAGVDGLLVITLTDTATGLPADCGFSFSVTVLPEPAATTTTTTTTTTVAP
jgi:hypothetical protein